MVVVCGELVVCVQRGSREFIFGGKRCCWICSMMIDLDAMVHGDCLITFFGFGRRKRFKNMKSCHYKSSSLAGEKNRQYYYKENTP